MAKKIEMTQARITTWHKKNRSRICIAVPNGKGKPKKVVLEFKTQERLEIFGDAVMGLLDEVEYDPVNDID